MKRWRSKAPLAALLAGAAALAIGLPAFGQDTPESLLPPGFGDPAPPVDTRPLPADPAAPVAPGFPSAPGTVTAAAPPPAPVAKPADEDEEEEAEAPEPFELPEEARRPIEVVGPLGPDETGLGADAFGDVNGRFVSTLMRRLEAPIASRWASIFLRRALLSHVPAPRGVAPADWVAERAWLLLRMGEADGARLLVQSVDVDRFTPKLTAVAAQVALATADPAALCPLVDAGESYSKEPVWPLARAMCAALQGESGVAGALIDRARRGRKTRDIDLLLAEKVVGAGVGGRRAINIEWEGVDRLTAWRFGLSNALGVTIPDGLLSDSGRQVQAWRARAPMVPLAARSEAALIAAALGVFSNANLVDLYGALAEENDAVDSPAGLLRAAYVGEDDDARMTAIRALWGDDATGFARYGRAVLTARAAARITPDEALGDDAAGLIAAMLSAGLDLPAARWGGVVDGLDAAAADDGWAMLAVGLPQPTVDVSYGRFDAFAGRAGDAGRLKAQLLFAGLAGLGRLSDRDIQRGAEALEVPLGGENRWTRALDLAVRSRQAGTVAVLAATGLQSRDWGGVPPQHLYRIVSALRRVGREGEARMIAAEAVARL